MEPGVAEFLELIKGAIKTREYLKWVAYAHRLLSLFDHEISLESQDIVSEIIHKVCTGKRNWNRNIDLDRFMYLNIASYFHNLKKRQCRLIYETDEAENEEDDDRIIDLAYSKNPDYVIDRYDLDNLSERCFNMLDDKEKKIFFRLKEGYSPYEIARKLGISTSEVYYLRKIIKKKIGRLLIR